MRAKLHSATRTGIYVLRTKGQNVPKIGEKLKAGKALVKVLDIIGPVQEPFLVVKPLKGNLEGEEFELRPIKFKKR